MKLQEIQTALEQAKSVAIFTHINPDGDALGSSFAMKAALTSLGKHAVVFLEKELPARYHYLNDGYSLTGDMTEFDVALALDCGASARLGSLEPLFLSAHKRLVVDHHYADTFFGDLHYTEPESAACAELVYLLIVGMCDTLPKTTLAPLYTGISTDTGQFKYSNVTSRTHLIAAELLKGGLDHRAITRHLYDTVKLKKLKFTGVLADKIKLYNDGQIAVLECFDSFLEQYGLSHEEVEELPNTVLSVEGVAVSVILKSREGGGIKASLRCKENIDLAVLASKFGGGGHKCAAGLVSALSAEELTNQLVSAITQELEAYHG